MKISAMGNRNCIVPIPADSDFTLSNLPYGIFRKNHQSPRAGVAIGEHILDLFALAEAKHLDIDPQVFSQSSLNAFISLGENVHQNIRNRIKVLLTGEPENAERFLVIQSGVELLVPVQAGDYTDFYSCRYHAERVGKMFRKNQEPLLPNWLHMPIAYHGRASSIIPTGYEVKRPDGQYLDSEKIVFGPTKALDYELEMAFVIGKNSAIGKPVKPSEAAEYIFGFVLLNDWSARDIQRWEYQPLGPFLGKNFATSVSPWIIPLEALQPFKCDGPEEQKTVLPYLEDPGKMYLDINLEIQINSSTVSKTNSRNLYWSFAQQLAHHTVNGCPVRVGDLMASGTISGSEPGTEGCLLEQSWNGTQAIAIGNTTRTFLQDGDEVVFKGHAGNGPDRVGFGELRNKIRG